MGPGSTRSHPESSYSCTRVRGRRRHWPFTDFNFDSKIFRYKKLKKRQYYLDDYVACMLAFAMF